MSIVAFALTLLSTQEPSVDPAVLRELQEAVRPLVEAKSYTAKVIVEQRIPLEVGEIRRSELELRFEREHPVQILGEEQEAFRGKKAIAFRARGSEDPWNRVSRTAALDDDPLSEVPLMAAVAEPHRLLAALDRRLVSLRKVESESESTVAVYEGEFGKGVLGDEWPAMLQVTVSPTDGVTEIRLAPKKDPARRLVDNTDWQFRLSAVGQTEVEVPKPVLDVLDD